METDTFHNFVKNIISHFGFGYKFERSIYENSSKEIFMIRCCLFFFKGIWQDSQDSTFLFSKTRPVLEIPYNLKKIKS